MSLPKLSIVLGGAASGKSSFAESLVLQGDHVPIYIATAQAFDDEMAQKILSHQQMRGSGWITIESPVHVADALAQAAPGQPVLLDCATLWLTNVLLGAHDLDAQTDAFFEGLRACAGPVVVVSNEVGYSIVPENALSRQFRNAQGRLNQRLAAEADLVITVMAGLPMVLKGALP